MDFINKYIIDKQDNSGLVKSETKPDYYLNNNKKIIDFIAGFILNGISLFLILKFWLSYPMNIVKSIISLFLLIIIFVLMGYFSRIGRKFIKIGMIFSIVAFLFYIYILIGTGMAYI